MAKKACWAVAALRDRRPGEGVGISRAIAVAFWNGKKWVKKPVPLVCGSPSTRMQSRALAMLPDRLSKRLDYGPVPMKMLVKLKSGNYDIHPEYSKNGLKTHPTYKMKV